MSRFPATPEEITPDWLSEVLAAEVATVEILDRHSGTTGRARLGLTYASGGDGPASVFVKLAPFQEAQRQLVAMTDMGRSEARLYAELGDEIPMRIPRSYHADFGDEPNDYVMVLEDLEAAGCRFPHNRASELGPDHGGRLVESLARVHAHFWEDPRFDADLSWVQPPRRGSGGARLIESALQQFEDQFPPAFGDLCRLYIEHHRAIVELWDDGEQTLIHGDTHGGNQFVDGDEVGIYDWAVISRSPGIRDIAIYMANSCPPEVRRSEQDRWLRRYREALVDAGVVDPPSEVVLLDRYRRTALYGWVAAATTAAMGSALQPIEIGMAGTARATEACSDIDTIGAFRDVL